MGLHGPLAPKLPEALAFLVDQRMAPVHRGAQASSFTIVHGPADSKQIRVRWQQRSLRGSRWVTSTLTAAVLEADLPEAWERAATRGLIPESWVQDAARGFSTRNPAVTPYPRTIGALLAWLAMGPELVARVESMVREAMHLVAGLGVPCKPLRQIVWRAHDPGTGRSPEYKGDLILSYIQREFQTLDPEAWRQFYTRRDRRPWQKETFAGGAFVLDHRGVPRSENPFAMLVELRSMGFQLQTTDGEVVELWHPVPERQDETDEERDDRRHEEDDRTVLAELREEGRLP